MPYAIWNSKYKKWLYGTDYNFSPPRQILDDDTPHIWRSDSTALWERWHRHCGKEYKVVEVVVTGVCIVEVKKQKGEAHE